MAEWKTRVESSITGLGDSLCLMNESLQTLVKKSTNKKRKTESKSSSSKQVSKKSKSSTLLVEPDLVQVRAQVDPQSHPLVSGFFFGIPSSRCRKLCF